jgi:hypothetical protein
MYPKFWLVSIMWLLMYHLNFWFQVHLSMIQYPLCIYKSKWTWGLLRSKSGCTRLNPIKLPYKEMGKCQFIGAVYFLVLSFNKLVIHSSSWNILLQVCSSRFHPQLIVYNAGTDILDGDPLGRLKVLLLNFIFKKPKHPPMQCCKMQRSCSRCH